MSFVTWQLTRVRLVKSESLVATTRVARWLDNSEHCLSLLSWYPRYRCRPLAGRKLQFTQQNLCLLRSIEIQEVRHEHKCNIQASFSSHFVWVTGWFTRETHKVNSNGLPSRTHLSILTCDGLITHHLDKQEGATLNLASSTHCVGQSYSQLANSYHSATQNGSATQLYKEYPAPGR